MSPKHHTTRFPIHILCAAVAAALTAGAATAADNQHQLAPTMQHKVPAQQMQKNLKEQKGDEGKPAGAVTPSRLEAIKNAPPAKLKEQGKGDKGEDNPADAVTPSRLKVNKGVSGNKLKEQGRGKGNPAGAVTPSRLKANQAVSTSNLKEHAEPIDKRTPPDARDKLPAVQDRHTLDGDAPDLSGRASLPDDAVRKIKEKDLNPRLRERLTGGGGFAGACDGPDPAAVLEVKRVVPRGEHSYDVHLQLRVENRGESDYRSSANQQGWRLVTGGGHEVESMNWGPNLAAGAHQDATYVAEAWTPGTEFVTDYELAIGYDPDIPIDGNPDNDDCRRGNNRAHISVAEIEREIERRIP